MRSKDIISIIAFISAFAVSAAFASLFIDKSQTVNYNVYTFKTAPNCQSRDQNCTAMLSLLVRDNILGAERNRRYDYSLGGENGNVSLKYAETTAEYSKEASDMNDANLPREFRQEWREHMQAWRDYSKFLNDVSQNKIDNEEFKNREARFNYEIDKTYADVLKVAKTYGVNNAYVY